MKLIDLHNHTNISYDGSIPPEKLVENAISHNISVLGICDHQFTIKNHLDEYADTLDRLIEKYKGKITIKKGLEIGTRPAPRDLNLSVLNNRFDYCLFECADSPAAMDFYELLEWTRLFKIKKGLAHTDIFYLGEHFGLNIFEVLKEYDLFWELNTSGNYYYYYDFLTNPKKQLAVKDSEITVSIGSDTHSLSDFNVKKLHSSTALIQKLGNSIIFS